MTEKSEHDVIIGIDLGTTNSEVAVVKQGQTTVIDSAPGTKILPSFVGLADDGSLLVGTAAKNQYTLYPERTIKSIKRRMGSADKVELGTVQYSPQEISALILKRLKAIAEAYLNCEVHKAVITVPAYFSDAQRQATREAGEIAGLDVVRMINEPTAAALSYEVDQQQRKRILVYDLGGGTFDVSIVSIEDNVVEVLASHGNNQLGGDDFDAKLVAHIVAHLQEQGIDISDSRKAMARINRAAETAKIMLSNQPYYVIEEEYLSERGDSTPINLSLEISRETFEELITPYIDETLEAIHIALKGADLTVADLDEVLLVGGATRTPLITRRLQQDLGIDVRSEINPDLCVAMGAAIQAAMLAGETVSSVLVDITPYTFGTSAFGDLDGMPYPYVYVPVIHKNTPIPITKSEVFFTMHDNQHKVKVDIYQGEDPDAMNNIQIGEFTVENLSKVAAGNPIVLQLTLDPNGLLQVSALEKNTGLEKSITINNAMASHQQNRLTDARERINALFDDEPVATITPQTTIDDGDQHIQQAQKLLKKAEEQLEQVSADDREDLINLIETINDAIAEQDSSTLQSAIEELSEILFYLES